MSAGALGQLGQLQSQQTQAAAQSQQGQQNPYAQMESGEFVNLLVQQMSNQDPMNPEDSTKVLEQLSNVRNIESQMQLQDKLESLVLQSEVSKASGLIGRTVQGVDARNDRVEGQVTAVRVQDDKATLELDSGKTLAMDRVTMISQGDAE